MARYDQDDKQAYAAAEAGVNEYLAHLDQDSNYWAQCLGPAGNPYPGVNQQFTGAPPAGRKWRAVPGTTNSDYSIELIRGQGAADDPCDPADPVGIMIDGGNLTIRSTGRVNGRKKRSVGGHFRRTGFLDFIYFTDLENQDPTYLDSLGPSSQTTTRRPERGGGQPARRGPATTASDTAGAPTAARPRIGRRVRRAPVVWKGIRTPTYAADTTVHHRGAHDGVCGEITFATDDQVNGPFHSNDDIQVCGTPDFGRDTRQRQGRDPGRRLARQLRGLEPAASGPR